MGKYDPATVRLRKAEAKRRRKQARTKARDNATFTDAAFHEAAGKRKHKRPNCPSRAGTWRVAPETTAAIGSAPYGDLVPGKHGGVIDTSGASRDKRMGDRRILDMLGIVLG